MACKTNSSPPTGLNQTHLQIDMTVVAFDSLGAIGGSGFYYKPVVWTGSFSPLWGDSVVRFLLDSNLTLQEFWYPDAPGICLDPFNHQWEIAKLAIPDTVILRFGYQSLPAGYSDVCVRHWRHYKITRVSGAA
jgi:hypothetical protein